MDERTDVAEGSFADVREADAIEAEAWRDMIDAAPPGFRSGVGLRAEIVHGATAIAASGIPITLFNRTIGAGLFEEPTEESIGDIIAWHAAASPSCAWIHVGAATPPLVREVLEKRGFTRPARARWAKFLRRHGSIPDAPTELAIREIAEAERDALGALIARAHEMPPPMAGWVAALAARPSWTAFGAFDGDAMVAGGMLYSRGTRAWLGLGGTLPSHRRRGAQRALMSARIERALASGSHTIATETGEPIAGEVNPSLQNMVRSGFVRVDGRENLASPARAG